MVFVKRTEEETKAINKLSTKIAENVIESKNPIATLREISEIGLKDLFIRKGGDELMVREVKGKTMDILFPQIRGSDGQNLAQNEALSTAKETSSTR